MIEIKKLTNTDRKNAADFAASYFISKGIPANDKIREFIVSNGVINKTVLEVDALLAHSTLDPEGNILGMGDRFKMWCVKHSREVPSGLLTQFMNREPCAAAQILQSDHPGLYRAYCTMLAGAK